MFDTSKPYGIIGGIFGVARFEQGGKYYDAQHTLLDNEGNPLKSKKQAQTSAPPVGSTNDSAGGEGQTAGQTTTPPAGNADANEKAALVARAKELKIKSPQLLGFDNLKAKIAQAEGALSPDAQLAANLAG